MSIAAFPDKGTDAPCSITEALCLCDTSVLGLAIFASLLPSVLAAVVHFLAHAALKSSLGLEAFVASCPALCSLTLCVLAATERAREARSGKKACRRVQDRWGVEAKELARVYSPGASKVAQSTSDLLETASAALSSAGARFLLLTDVCQTLQGCKYEPAFSLKAGTT